MTTTTGTPRQSRPAADVPAPHSRHRGHPVTWTILAGIGVAAVIGAGVATHRSGQVTLQNPTSTRTVPEMQSGARAGGKHVVTTSRPADVTVTHETTSAVKVPDAAKRLQARYGAHGTS